MRHNIGLPIRTTDTPGAVRFCRFELGVGGCRGGGVVGLVAVRGGAARSYVVEDGVGLPVDEVREDLLGVAEDDSSGEDLG